MDRVFLRLNHRHVVPGLPPAVGGGQPGDSRAYDKDVFGSHNRSPSLLRLGDRYSLSLSQCRRLEVFDCRTPPTVAEEPALGLLKGL